MNGLLKITRQRAVDPAGGKEMDTVAFLPRIEIFKIQNLADWNTNVIYINGKRL